MKRSEINHLIEEAISFFNENKFYLPKWAYWAPEDWKGKQVKEITDKMLGWDLTDFGSGKFFERGLLLFTLRNGRLNSKGKCYAEKIMVVRENQETPFHFHWTKHEDIINRGGAKLVIQLYKSTKDEKFSDEKVTVMIDDIPKTVKAGGEVVLEPGESIFLEPYVYHRFYATGGTALVGEVSSVNDDNTDNRFYEELGRFPEIEEDVKPNHLLVIDYPQWV